MKKYIFFSIIAIMVLFGANNAAMADSSYDGTYEITQVAKGAAMKYTIYVKDSHLTGGTNYKFEEGGNSISIDISLKGDVSASGAISGKISGNFATSMFGGQASALSGTISGQVKNEKTSGSMTLTVVMTSHSTKCTPVDWFGTGEAQDGTCADSTDTFDLTLPRISAPEAEPEPVDESKLENFGTETTGGKMSSVSGEADMKCPPNYEWEPLSLRSKLLVGCHLKVGEDSSAIINFSDMTVFQMKSNSEIVLTSSLTKQESKLGMVAGNIWINIKRMYKYGSLNVEMSQGVCGIKGTTFVLSETGTKSTVKVIEGIVKFTPKSGGSSVDINAGEMLSAAGGKLSPKTTFNIAEEQKQWTEIKEPPKSKIKMPAIIGGAAGLVILLVIFFILKSRKK